MKDNAIYTYTMYTHSHSLDKLGCMDIMYIDDQV